MDYCTTTYWTKLKIGPPKKEQSQYLLQRPSPWRIQEALEFVGQCQNLCNCSVSHFFTFGKRSELFFSFLLSVSSILCHTVRLLSRGVNCGTLVTTDCTETPNQTPHQCDAGLLTVYQLSELSESVLMCFNGI